MIHVRGRGVKNHAHFGNFLTSPQLEPKILDVDVPILVLTPNFWNLRNGLMPKFENSRSAVLMF